ncbi:hypothetical protein DKX38_002427 [Salix brachista]|uniref:Biotin protein ligase C-terminal domain-containing protein n=1 Tax=Salix brachista TaxID=2182728 RepID=A0A5N5NM76_9ROSI|nr:hypothetical protein DKX38_002427 [Salix brachista]
MYSYDFVLRCSCSGQRVIIQEKNENQVVESVVTIQGLTSSGYLLAISEDNHMCELHPDGNRITWTHLHSDHYVTFLNRSPWPVLTSSKD